MKTLFLFFLVALVCGVPTGVAQDDGAPKSLSNVTSPEKLQQLQMQLQGAIEKELRVLPSKTKALVGKYFKQTPFPDQKKLLLGMWHGHSKDQTVESHWLYERHGDGTVRSTGIDLMPKDREYDEFGWDIVWTTRGRVIFEQKVSEPEYLDIYLLESLDKKSMKYRIVFEDEPVQAWALETDNRGSTQLPKPPDGWKKWVR